MQASSGLAAAESGGQEEGAPARDYDVCSRASQLLEALLAVENFSKAPLKFSNWVGIVLE